LYRISSIANTVLQGSFSFVWACNCEGDDDGDHNDNSDDGGGVDDDDDDDDDD
jgi:hypothetical protein